MSTSATSRGLCALALALLLTSCGLLGSEDNASESGDGVETTDLNVSIMVTVDSTPFHLAVQEGLFEDEGLTVSHVTAPNGSDSVTKLISGEVDIAYASHTPFFLAEHKGVARGKGGVKIIAGASTAGPGSSLVVALPDSPVRNMRDMAGKRVGITARGTMSDLMVMSALKTNGVDHTTIQWVQMAFPEMADRLAAREIDAAFAIEPFIQDAVRRAGAVPVFDTAVGPTANIPTAGYASTGDFAKRNPKTIAAFQRVMQRATDMALADRGLVEPLLEKFAKVDEQTARNGTFLTFASELDAKRLQRVPDLMAEFGVIPGTMDVSTMIVPTAPLN